MQQKLTVRLRVSARLLSIVESIAVPFGDDLYVEPALP